MAYPDPITGEIKHSLQRVDYTHDAMIDLIISNPAIEQNELARHFGYSPSWVSTVKNSDAFQARLAGRRKELIDPAIVASIDEKFRAMADVSLAKIIERLHVAPSEDFLLSTAKLAAGALGYGGKVQQASSQVNVAVVVQVPSKIPSSADWAAQHAIPVAQRVA